MSLLKLSLAMSRILEQLKDSVDAAGKPRQVNYSDKVLPSLVNALRQHFQHGNPVFGNPSSAHFKFFSFLEL